MSESQIKKITKEEFISKILDAIKDNIENKLDDETFITYAKVLYKAYKFGYKIFEFNN